MNIEEIRMHVKNAETLLRKMREVDASTRWPVAMEFAHEVEAARAALNQAKLRSEDQTFVRECIEHYVDGLTTEASGIMGAS